MYYCFLPSNIQLSVKTRESILCYNDNWVLKSYGTKLEKSHDFLECGYSSWRRAFNNWSPAILKHTVLCWTYPFRCISWTAISRSGINDSIVWHDRSTSWNFFSEASLKQSQNYHYKVTVQTPSNSMNHNENNQLLPRLKQSDVQISKIEKKLIII